MAVARKARNCLSSEVEKPEFDFCLLCPQPYVSLNCCQHILGFFPTCKDLQFPGLRKWQGKDSSNKCHLSSVHLHKPADKTVQLFKPEALLTPFILKHDFEFRLELPRGQLESCQGLFEARQGQIKLLRAEGVGRKQQNASVSKDPSYVAVAVARAVAMAVEGEAGAMTLCKL